MKNSNYYCFCTPENKNKGSFNFGIPVNPNWYLVKDFLFDQVVNGKHYYKVISRFHVKEKAQLYTYKKCIDMENLIYKTCYFYYMTLTDILNAPELKI